MANLTNNGITGLWIDGKPVRRASLGGKVFFEKHNYDLSLVSDKDIISCYDHDTATLTATLTDYNDPIEGETVLMYDSNRISKRKNNILFSLPLDFELILTTSDVITISPVSYDSGTLRIVRAGGSVSVYRLQNDNWIQTMGVSNPTEILIPISNTEVISSSGDIPFFAMGITDNSGECNVVYDSKGAGDLNIKCECMNLQETYDLEDCLKVWGSISTTRDLNYAMPSTPFEVDYTFTRSNGAGYVRIGTNANNCILVGQVGGDGSNGIGRRNNGSYGDLQIASTKPTKNVPIDIKCKFTGSQYEYTIGNETLTQSDVDQALTTLLNVYLPYGGTFNNLRIKPL